MKSILVFLGCLLLSITAFLKNSQKIGTIEGIVVSVSNETLPYASVILKTVIRN